MTTNTAEDGERSQGASRGKKTKGGGRKPIAPVKVGQGRNWAPIALFTVVILAAAGIVGYGFWASLKKTAPWQERAAAIKDIVNYRELTPEIMSDESRDHQVGTLEYDATPPAGGDHNGAWQDCQGAVYTEPIADEHAVHSLEHGAVWITYDPTLPADQVALLEDRVRGQDKTFMSPYADLDTPISLQAWGYQLKVDDAGDDRIDEFIKALRVNASLEGPTALCSGGISTTDTTPVDVGDLMEN